MFKWATVAKRPLHIEEFKEAVAFDQNDKSWNEDRIPHEDRMFESCRGLIIKDDDDQTVRFAHHTVSQYLTTSLSTNIDLFFQISTIEAETFAGQICVGYLLFSDFETQLATTPLNLGNQGVLQSGGPLKIPETLGIKVPVTLPYRLLRERSGSRAPKMDYSKDLNSRFQAKTHSPVARNDKYRLLQYVIEYWETHVRSYPTSDAKLHVPLGRLALEKTLMFEFRPWGPNQHHGPHGCVGCPNPKTTDLDLADLPHISMLHYAAEVGNMPLLLLIQNSVGLQHRDISMYLHHERYHDETLLIACHHGRIEVVKYLTKLKRFNIADGRAVSAASTAGHADVLQYLLSVDRSWIGQHGEKLLLAAAKNGFDAVIDVLVDAGVNLFTATDQQTGWGVLELAAMNGHHLVVRSFVIDGGALKRAPKVNPYEPLARETVLNDAATGGHAAAVGAPLESVLWHPDTIRNALIAAARSGHSAVAEVLLEYHTNPALTVLEIESRADKHGESAFHVAARNGHVGILELFRDYVQFVDYPRSDDGFTALHIAALAGQTKVVCWLVDNGADVNAFTRSGDTPLSFAISAGEETIVRVLVEHGAIVLMMRIEVILAGAAMREEITILESLLGTMREEQFRHELYRKIIVDTLGFVRREQRMAAVAILEQELKIYPERKTEDYSPK